MLDTIDFSSLDNEEAVGMNIVKEALKTPFKRLVANAGLDSGEILAELKNQVNMVDNVWVYFGFDVTDGKFKDMLKAGIIDPVKVTKSALENAASVAMTV